AQNVQETGGPDGYIRGNADRGPVDFISTLTGALVIKDGNGSRLYDVDLQTNAQNRIFASYRPALDKDHILPYNHLPFEALLITPFMNLPYPIVFALWTLICGIAIGMSLGLLDGALPVARPVGWVLSMAACAYMPLIRGLMQGQNSPLILLGLCGVYVALKRGQPEWAGAALVLLALKPQVLPVILLLLVLQKQWKTLAVFTGILTGLSVLAMPFLGFDWPLKYAQLLIGVAGWGNTGAIDPSIMHNWRGFLTNLLGPNSGLVSPLFAILSLATALMVAYVWWRTSVKKQEMGSRSTEYAVAQSDEEYNPNFDLVWALAGFAAVLTALHLNPHDLTLLVFPAWIIGAYATSGLWSRRLSLVWVVLLWVGWAFAPLTLTNAQGIVVPSVLLMAVACGLISWQLVGRAPASSARQAVPI
ncbi:MAG: glycosyltransferase family 87 protein, partial [Chloroflexia bacterium]